MLALLAGLLVLSLWLPLQNPPAIPNSWFPTRAGDHASILPDTQALPDFTAYRDVRTKKLEFLNYMLPMVRHANRQINADRSRLLAIRDEVKAGTTLAPSALAFLGGVKKHYQVPPQPDLPVLIDALLIRVDVVPASLVLAQSAKESGWGTSRFAREANNLFGIRCFRKGCGLTPLARKTGLTHEVARYDSVQGNIEAYIRTINTHPAYEQLRLMRADSRLLEDQRLCGLTLAEGLLRYSVRGLDYIREIQQIIRVNKLYQYTLPLRA